MHLAARVLALAILPSVAAAQRKAHASSPARVLVLDCPSTASVPSMRASFELERADSLGTSGLVALLCAKAQSTRIDAPAARAEPHGTHASARPASADHAADADPSEPTGPIEPLLRVHLFGDVRYSATDSVGSKNGFGLGQLDLFARSQLSDNLSVLSEATLTALPRNTFNAKLERLLLTFAPSDRFNASVGRFHTGIGYYNAAYHHGSWFQTAVGRPLAFGIDGDIGIVPIHTLGVSASGEIPSGALGLRYVAELGSGRAGQSSAAIAPQPGLNDNNSLSINAGLIARPERFDGLQFGVSVYRDRLTLADTSKAAIDETISAVHALYKTDAVELLGEALLLRHQPQSATPANDVKACYAQASRRFRAVRPYVRVDYVEVPRTNQLFGFLGRRSGPTVGIRYDFDALAALKVQTSHLNQTTRPTMNRVDAQVSFMF
ncbi:MAG: hypothetical protein ABI601_05440 [bacterium]